MSFWRGDHKEQGKYNIIWKNYIPATGKCYCNAAECVRLVGGVYYQLFKNGSWFGDDNYHVKHYVKKDYLYCIANTFMYGLEQDYKNEVNNRWESYVSYADQCDIMDDIMGKVIVEAWNILADENDEIELNTRINNN